MIGGTNKQEKVFTYPIPAIATKNNNKNGISVHRRVSESSKSIIHDKDKLESKDPTNKSTNPPKISSRNFTKIHNQQ